LEWVRGAAYSTVVPALSRTHAPRRRLRPRWRTRGRRATPVVTVPAFAGTTAAHRHCERSEAIQRRVDYSVILPRDRGASEQHAGYELLRCLASCVDHQDIQALDVGHGAAGDALEIAVEAGGGVEHATELLLALGPQPHHGLAFAVEVRLHLGEALDDGVDAVTESRAGQVGIDQLHLALLALL